MKKVKTYLREVDLIAEVPSARLHFGKSSSHKTIIGGMCTMIAILLFICLAIYQGYFIVYRKTPYTSSIEAPIEYDHPDGGVWKMRLN